MIGTDIEEIRRIERIGRDKPNLLRRLFFPEEWAHALTKPNPWQTLTGIWCAKEAVWKACSNRAKFGVRDVCIRHRPSGRPEVWIAGLDWSEGIEVSISHTAKYAVAVALGLTA
ncbi:holo-ACP synthase [Cyclobacterium xiamenense]|uniref:holo-ACP synthase n=1 Tax=Cyclobacterium xiamenense TaxID=1297121 RepID=UPI0012B700F2|nr:4'-phosphopantetheinyl transferase superfamily protein [Cyclobacterium xiamenense]